MFALLWSITAHAYDIEVNGMYYNITDNQTKTVEVTYVEFGEGNADFYYGNVTIPKRISTNGVTYTVTAIGDYAFYFCSNLASINIPTSVTSIGEGAFEDCPLLTSISIPESITSIGVYSFCHSGLTSVVIPNSVTFIGGSAFLGCNSLTSATISNNVTEINMWTFGECPNLNTIIIPNGVTIIGEYAFYHCSFTSVIIPESVSTISDYAFYYCNNLMSITIPERVTSIGQRAFGYCNNLHNLTFEPKTPPTYPSTNPVFNNTPTIIVPQGCKAAYETAGWNQSCTVREENIQDGDLYYTILSEADATVGVCKGYYINENGYVRDAEYSGNLTVPATINYEGKTYTVTEICDYTFQAAAAGFNGREKGLTGITLPQTLRRIGMSAFTQSDLQSVVIPKSVTTMGGLNSYTGVYLENPFMMCSKLSTISVEAGNPVYDSRDNCNAIIKTGSNELISSSLSTVIPVSVKSIGRFSFSATGKESVVIPSGVEEIKERAFYCVNHSYLKSVTIPETVKNIGEYAFTECTLLESIELPDNISVIGKYTFSGCESLQTVKLPKNLKSIGYGAFEYTESLSSIYFPDKLTEISHGAFSYSNLSVLRLSNQIETVGEDAFDFCTNLNTIIIPASLQSIGQCAFDGSTNITSVTAMSPEPASIIATTFGTDNNPINPNAMLYVPAGSKAKYQAATGWNMFPNISEFSVTCHINASDISGTGGTAVQLPISVTDEGNTIGVQFDLLLPEGISIATDDEGFVKAIMGDRSNGHTFTASKVDDGHYSFVIANMQNRILQGTTGTVITIELNVDKNIILGDYDILITDAKLSVKNGTEQAGVILSNSASTLSVSDITPGDVNGDGDIDIVDVTSTISYVIHQPPTVFIVGAADVNHDGTVDIVDVTTIIEMVLNKGRNQQNIKRKWDTIEPE